MPNRLHELNRERVQAMQRDIPHHVRTWALTGKLNDDGITVNPDTLAGLAARYMWVRVEGERTETRALIGAGMFPYYRRPNRKIWVGYNHVNELVAIEPFTDNTTAYTEGDAPYNGDDEGSAPLATLFLKGLRVLPPRDTHASGLWVHLEAEPALGWLGADVEVTDGEPPNSGEFGFTSVYLDEVDRLPYIHVHAAEVKPDMWQLPFDPYVLIAQLPYAVYPAGAVALFNGQTEVTRVNTRFEDLRVFVNKKRADVNHIMTSADGYVMVDADGYVMVST